MKPDEIETIEEFGEAARRLWKLTGLTRDQVAEVAEAAGTPISGGTVTTICNGRNIPRPHYLRVFLNAVGVEDVEEHRAWQKARERLWAQRRTGEAGPNTDAPADLRLRRIEEELAGLRGEVARMQGMLLGLAQAVGNLGRDG